jgi:uncharacterized protein (TIGR02271 family)
MTNKIDEQTASVIQSTEIIDADKTTMIPVIQEEVVFEKRVVESGKVRISKRIKEYEEIIDEPLFREQVNVERVPINQVIEARPAVRQEGDTMIIPVVQEQVFVQKRLVLVEELHVKKQVIETHQPQRVTLLKEEVDIIRSAENNNVGS